MALQYIPGLPYITIPEHSFLLVNNGPSFTGTTLDASLEAFMATGRVVWSDGGSHTISSSGGKIGWNTGTVTWADSSSVFTIGIQDADAANGPPGRGDGTFDVYATLNQGVETIASNTAYETAMETGTKTLATGALISIVAEFTTRGGADSIIIQRTTASYHGHQPSVVTYLSSSYAGQTNGYPCFWLVADDGTYGTLIGSFPITVVGTGVGNVNNTSTTKEYGNLFTLPFDCEIAGMYSSFTDNNSTGSAEFNLYTDPLNTGAGVTEVAESVFQARSGRGSTAQGIGYYWFTTPYTYDANTLMAMAGRPTSATNVSYSYFEAFSNAALDTFALGSDCYAVSRNTVGSTTAFSTYGSTARRMNMGLMLSKLDDGAGGGTTIAGTPMRRGMV